MIKKVLFILFLMLYFEGFSQEKLIINLSTAPNPFRNETMITFNTSEETSVILRVRNILGKTVFQKEYTAKNGINTIPFYKNNVFSFVQHAYKVLVALSFVFLLYS